MKAILLLLLLLISLRLDAFVSNGGHLRTQSFQLPRNPTILRTANSKDVQTNYLTEKEPPYALYLTTFVGLPVVAQIFPLLLQHITDFSIPAPERSVWIIAFLLSKRFYLYSTAIIAVLMSVFMKDSLQMFRLSLGQVRCSPLLLTDMLILSLFQRYRKLNEQLFGADFFTSNTNGTATVSPEIESFYQQLDGIQDTKQALALPIILLVTLGTGYLLYSINPFHLPNELFSYSSIISSFPIVIVSMLFSKLQINNILDLVVKDKDTVKDNSLISTILAITLVCASFFAPTISWPLRNIINIFIAMTASELFQFQRFPAIVLALLGLTLYDVFGVYGSQSFTDNGQSIMEAVARANIALTNGAVATQSAAGSVIASAIKEAGTSIATAVKEFQFWSPGLFQVVINNRISDVLGLGDIIFPSVLVRWAKYFDTREGENVNDRKSKLYNSAIGGYVIGLVMCEIFQTGSGAPALLFLVPSMLLSLGISILFSKIPLSVLNE